MKFMFSLVRDNLSKFFLYAILSVAIIFTHQRMNIPIYHSLVLLVLLLLLFFKNVIYHSFLFVFSIFTLGFIVFIDGTFLSETLISIAGVLFALLVFHFSQRVFFPTKTGKTMFSDSILNLINDGVVIWNRDGEILDWNHRMEEISLIPRENVIGTRLQDLITRNLSEEYMTEEYQGWLKQTFSMLSGALSLKSKSNEFFLKLKGNQEGAYIYLQARIFYLDLENLNYLGAICRDATEQKTMEMDLKKNQARLNAILEDQEDMISPPSAPGQRANHRNRLPLRLQEPRSACPGTMPDSWRCDTADKNCQYRCPTIHMMFRREGILAPHFHQFSVTSIHLKWKEQGMR